ncbi:MAG TPA: LysR family transcriptional regulator [Enhygromyxa sp.]|nr:LysR family transcriptional regulator [Enhygromyxa sp.]
MDLEETRAFLAVIEHGSFKAAAENLNQPRATLRRRVESLEVRAGVPLLERSRNGVEATAAGAILARHGRTLLRETEALLHTLRELDDGAPRGSLRIGVPASLPADGVALVFGLFRTKFPQLCIDLRVAADPVAELLDEVDLALHLGGARPGQRWTTRPLVQVRETLVASQSYLERHGALRSIDELAEHVLLACRSGAAVERWPLLGGGSVAIEPAMRADNPQLLRRLVGCGFGIALLPDIDLGDRESDDDELTPVLDQQIGRQLTLSAVMPEVLVETPKLRAIVAHLERFFGRRERLHSVPRFESRPEPISLGA